MPAKPHNLDKLVARLMEAQRRLRDNIKKEITIDPFSLAKLEVLHHVGENPSSTMRDIAKLLCITPPSTTTLVDGLVKGGHLARSPDPKDRRKIRLTLTSKGHTVMAKGMQKIKLHMRATLSKLTHHEQKQFIAILEKLSRSYE